MAQQQSRNAQQGSCPSRDHLMQWLQEQLSLDELATLLPHVESCAACLKTLDELVAADPISQHLLQQPPTVSDTEKAELASIVQQLRGRKPTHDLTALDTSLNADETNVPVPDSAPAVSANSRLGDYRIQQLLGQGGMGQVFQAEDVRLRRSVAVKVLRTDLGHQAGARERFLREARAAAAVRHPHVVTIYQVGESDGIPFLVMELLQGEALEARCQQGPPLSVSEVVSIGRQVAEGLAAAHAQGLTHRDIKPDNIWLEQPSGQVKLLDFGLARAADGDVRLTRNGVIVGTPAYMSPEQAAGLAVEARSDLFSLGSVLFRLLAGRVPFQGDSPLTTLHALANDTPPLLHTLNPEVPESLSNLVASLLARRPQDRPASAQAVAEQLAAIAAAPKAQPRRAPRRPVKLGLWLATVGVLALAVATVVRVQTDRGEIVVETTDPAVAVLFEQGKVHIQERTSGRKYSLAVGAQKSPSGEYELVVSDEPAGLRFTTRQFTLKRGDSVLVVVSFLPKTVAVPADSLKRADIPDDVLLRLGGGDKTKVPAELVAVLGGARRFPTEFAHHTYLCTRYSPDGRWVATCANREVLVYEVSSGRVVWRLAHEGPCGWFDFRPDNKALAISWEQGIAVWDLSNGKNLATLAGHAHLNRGVSWTADGKALLSTDSDGKARLWDIGSGTPVRAFDPPEGLRFTQPPQVHPDNRLVALHASGDKPVVRIVDIATGEKKAEVPGCYGAELKTTVGFTRDGRLLATVQLSQAAHLWDVSTWKEVGTFEHSASILTFSADGQKLFRGHPWSGNGVWVHVDDVKPLLVRAPRLLPMAADHCWSDLSPDGKTVVVRTSRTRWLRFFDAATGKEHDYRAGHHGVVNAVAVSPDGQWAISTGTDQRALQWNLRTGQVVRELAFPFDAYQAMDAAAYSPDGKWVAARRHDASEAGWTRVWDAGTGKEVVSLPSKQLWQLTEFAFHPKSTSLLGTDGTRLVQWGLPDGSSSVWESGHTRSIETVDVHPNGKLAASADPTGMVCVHDLATQKQLMTFRCPAPVWRVRFSPDGTTLAAATKAPDAAVYLWNLETRGQRRLAGHTGDVRGLAWRRDSQLLASASYDGTVRLWGLTGAGESRTIRLNAGLLCQPAFTPEGRHLITANEDGSLYVLRLE